MFSKNNLLSTINQKLFYRSAEIVRRFRHPDKYVTLRTLYDYLKNQGLSISLSVKAQAKLDMIIPQICTFESWYVPKNSVYLVSTQIHADEAIKKGAGVLIAEKQFNDYPTILCTNRVEVYCKMCGYFRDLSPKVSVTAVTGSIGKTTVNTMVGQVYSTKYETFYTDSNSNTKTSIGFAVQHIPSGTEKMVQEIHEGSPGETRFVSEMIHPDILVLTAIDNSHMEFFGSHDKIVEEVCSSADGMHPGGIVIVNKDDFHRYDLLGSKRVLTISMNSNEADFFAQNVHVNEKGLFFDLVVNETGEKGHVQLPNIYAEHNVLCALYAFAAGVCQGISVHDIVCALSLYKTRGVRQNVLRTNDNILVYADCFNAVGKSVRSAIDASESIPVNGKRVAVLGNVEEVGDLSEDMHKDILMYVNNSSFDHLLIYGDKLDSALKRIQLRKTLNVESFSSKKKLNERIRNLVSGGDLVLFKSSHSGRLDRCILDLWPELADEVNYNSASREKWKRSCLFC